MSQKTIVVCLKSRFVRSLCVALLPAMAPAVNAAATSVTIYPTTATTAPAGKQQYKAAVAGTFNQSVTWSVNGIVGGNSSVGTISTAGLYTAPSPVSAPFSVTVTATSVANPALSATATDSITNPQPAISSISPSNVPVGISFKLTITGTGFVSGSVVSFAGQNLTTTYVSPTQITATGTTKALTGGMAAVTVANPTPSPGGSNMVVETVGPASPAVPAEAAARFLGQASWGPNAASIVNVQQVGYAQYLAQQFATAPTPYPSTLDSNPAMTAVQSQFFVNAITGQDQLRQRVAFALGQIFVVSGNVLMSPSQVVPFLRILQNDAFSNYRTIMNDVTLSPSMGAFLGMVYNPAGNPMMGTAPNENYARELMQLFTIGVQELNIDGTPQLDASGNPIPTYTQKTISETARALTGWTFPTQPGATPGNFNPPYFVGPMIPVNALHDTGSKTILNGVVLPAGQTSQQDLTSVLNTVFAHPNVGPFVAQRLIQSLVTSNPSPAYISRVASVFNNNGQGVRGDMKAVVQAILLDTEARSGDYPNAPGTNQGHLLEPIVYMTALARAVESTPAAANSLGPDSYNLGEFLLYPPSVFNFFPPNFQIPGTTINGPEFAIETSGAAVSRVNFANNVAFAPATTSLTYDITALTALAAGDQGKLVDALNRAFMRGQMSSQMRSAILGALSAATSNIQAVQTALYLVGSSSQYTVLR